MLSFWKYKQAARTPNSLCVMAEGMDIDEQPGPSAAEKGKAVVANGTAAPASAPSKGYELPWVGVGLLASAQYLDHTSVSYVFTFISSVALLCNCHNTICPMHVRGL